MSDTVDLQRQIDTLRAAIDRLTSYQDIGYAGTYTPTLTGVLNVAASTAYVCEYSRVGSVVTVGGRFAVDPTAAGLFLLGLSLPIASDFTITEQLGGTAMCTELFMGGVFEGDITNNRAQMRMIPTDTSNRSYHFTFVYVIV